MHRLTHLYSEFIFLSCLVPASVFHNDFQPVSHAFLYPLRVLNDQDALLQPEQYKLSVDINLIRSNPSLRIAHPETYVAVRTPSAPSQGSDARSDRICLYRKCTERTDGCLYPTVGVCSSHRCFPLAHPLLDVIFRGICYGQRRTPISNGQKPCKGAGPASST